MQHESSLLVRATYCTLNKFDAAKISQSVGIILQSPAYTIFMQVLVANFSQISFSNMSSKKPKYDKSYIQYGFTSVIVSGVERPQRVLCNKVLSNDTMTPVKLKQHLQNVHPQSEDKNKSCFERQNKALKMMRLDASSKFFRRNSKIAEASYEVAQEIAKQKNTHYGGRINQALCFENG